MWVSHKNTNAFSTKHISSPTSDKCLRQITSKCCRFQTIIAVAVTTQPYHTVFQFRHSPLIITLYWTYEVDRPKSSRLLTDFSFMTTSHSATVPNIKAALCSQRPFRYLGGGTYPSTHGFTGAILAWRIQTRVET